jgi:DtxR family Mn-dependent transcriptional regulator
MVSPSLEDYLETIYFLSEKTDQVRVTDVANELNIKKPSVNKAVNILKAQGYVLHEKYGALFLTEEGLRVARSVASRHKVLKRFLTEILLIEDAKAEQEACSIEHWLSPETIAKLSDYIDKTLIRATGQPQRF